MRNKQVEQILTLLRQFRRRMLAHDALRWMQRYLWIPALAMLAVQAAGRIWPVSDLLIYTLIPPAIFLMAVLIYLMVLPKSDLSVAWRVDQDLRLKERVSSVIAFESKAPHVTPESADLFAKQRRDALESLKHANPRASFRFIPARRRLLTAGVLISAVIALALIPLVCKGLRELCEGLHLTRAAAAWRRSRLWAKICSYPL